MDDKQKPDASPAKKSTSSPKIDVKPTNKNRRRYAALLYAGVTAISIATMLTLVGLKPRVQLSLKSRDDQPILPEINNLIAACQFPYHGCNQPEAFINQLPFPENIRQEINQISKRHNLNPQLLLTIHSLQNQTTNLNELTIDTKKLEDTAQKLRWRRDQTNHIQPVLQHPLYGSYKLNNFTQESYALLQYLAQMSHNQATFKQTIANPVDDGKTSGFIETYNSLSPK